MERIRPLTTNEERLRTEEQAYRQGRLCRANRCDEAPEVAKALGHDRLAHHVINRLVHAGVRTAAQLRALTDNELDRIRGIGAGAVARIRVNFPPDDR